MTKEEKHKKKNDRRYVAGGIFVTAGIILGLGIGIAIDKTVAGLFIGLGAGFLLFALTMVFVRD